MRFILLTILSVIVLVSCDGKKPSRAEVIKEANRREMNVVDGTGFEASGKIEEELLDQLRVAPINRGGFEYRRLEILGEPTRLSIVVFGIDRESKDVKEAVRKVLENHQLTTIRLVHERVVEDDEQRILSFDALDYRIVDGNLVSEAVGEVDPGIIGKISK